MQYKHVPATPWKNGLLCEVFVTKITNTKDNHNIETPIIIRLIFIWFLGIIIQIFVTFRFGIVKNIAGFIVFGFWRTSWCFLILIGRIFMNKYSHNSFGPVWFVIVYWITCFTFWWFLIIISRIFFMNDYSHNPFGPVWFVIFFWFTFLVFWCFLMIITIRFFMYESTLTIVIVFWFTFFIYFSLRSIRNSPIASMFLHSPRNRVTSW